MRDTATIIEQSNAPRLENLKTVSAPFGKGQWLRGTTSVFPAQFTQEIAAFCLDPTGTKGAGFGVAVRVRDQQGDAYIRVEYSAQGHAVRTTVTLPPALEGKRDEMRIPKNEQELIALGDTIISELKGLGPEICLPLLPPSERGTVVQA